MITPPGSGNLLLHQQVQLVQDSDFTEKSLQEKKEIGQYFTPSNIAKYMAGLFDELPSKIRVLDPGAGTGALTIAVCERILQSNQQHDVEIVLYETDRGVLPKLQSVMTACKKALNSRGHTMRFAIRENDFILSAIPSGQQTFETNAPVEKFDFVIMNPPYFKIPKDSKHAKVMEAFYRGQPNIYSQFMALGAHLLKDNGQLVSITPRSFCNGLYFKGFRKYFLQRMKIQKIHIFESRQDAFKKDSVLQENIILVARKTTTPQTKVTIISSKNHHDLVHSTRYNVGYNELLYDAGNDNFIRIPTQQSPTQAAIDRLSDTFTSLGYKISTGPVVIFRAKEHLLDAQQEDTTPLLSMHNVTPLSFNLSQKRGKPAFIQCKKDTKALLVPVQNMVLIKRFSSKEQNRRLTAGVLLATEFPHTTIGLENHLNYIVAANGQMTREETYGLAALFNSQVYDDYFRAISGNTQVNATEIRTLKLPSKQSICKIGQKLLEQRPPTEKVINNVVRAAILV